MDTFKVGDRVKYKDGSPYYGSNEVLRVEGNQVFYTDGNGWDYMSDLELEQSSEPTLWSTQVGGDHYSKRAIQPLQYILANKLGFAEGNIVKYATRLWDKDDPIKNLDKIIDYAMKLKDDITNNPERYKRD
jgi:hypothetical protein